MMRLLNIHTLRFQVFTSEIPPYAITPHRWIGDETTYQEVSNYKGNPQIEESPGFQKVRRFCEFMREWGKGIGSRPGQELGFCRNCSSRAYRCDRKLPRCANCKHDSLSCDYPNPNEVHMPLPDVSAPTSGVQGQKVEGLAAAACKTCVAADTRCSSNRPTCSRCQVEGIYCDYSTPASAVPGFTSRKDDLVLIEWIWIDTCCIDKSSSNELAEAINSMFTWYAGAYACLAYLHDVVSDVSAPSALLVQFKKSSWFKRGWTLQELLAPKLVVFLNHDWQVFGHKAGDPKRAPLLSATKVQWPLNPWIAKITNINENVLLHSSYIHELTFQERFKWMDNRRTTRPEDSAYCLLGILAIHMPLIYGEGSGAFDRLQEAILKKFPQSQQEFQTTDPCPYLPDDDWSVMPRPGAIERLKVKCQEKNSKKTSKAEKPDRDLFHDLLGGKRSSKAKDFPFDEVIGGPPTMDPFTEIGRDHNVANIPPNNWHQPMPPFGPPPGAIPAGAPFPPSQYPIEQHGGNPFEPRPHFRTPIHLETQQGYSTHLHDPDVYKPHPYPNHSLPVFERAEDSPYRHAQFSRRHGSGTPSNYNHGRGRTRSRSRPPYIHEDSDRRYSRSITPIPRRNRRQGAGQSPVSRRYRQRDSDDRIDDDNIDIMLNSVVERKVEERLSTMLKDLDLRSGGSHRRETRKKSPDHSQSLFFW